MKTTLLKKIRSKYIIQSEIDSESDEPIYVVSHKKHHTRTSISLKWFPHLPYHTHPKEYKRQLHEELIKFLLQEVVGANDSYGYGGKGMKLYNKNRQKREYNIQIRKQKQNGTFTIIK